MRLKIATRPSNVTESITLAISAQAAALRALGHDVISLAAGEPDFEPVDAVRCAASAFLERRDGRYTATSGTHEARDAIARFAAASCGLDVKPENVLVTAGTKPAIHIALLTLLEPGDEVLVLAPYWVSYPDIVHLAGGVARILVGDAARGFAPDFAAVERALTPPRRRALGINSPNTPTGRILTAEELATLHLLARKHEVTILSDEIYASVCTPDLERAPSPADHDIGLEQTLVFDGLSKSHAIPGWRLGWMLGPRDFVAAAGRLQSHLLGNASSIAQAAAACAFTDETRASLRRMVTEISARRELFVQATRELRGFSLAVPEGAFYAFPNVQALQDRLGINDEDLASRLLREASVAIVPGSAFGVPGHLRFSLTRDRATIDEAVRRLRVWIDENLPA